MLPIISVVIPCYRARPYILDVIHGLPDFITHIIVVDDGCPDKTGEYVQSYHYDKVQIIFREKNGGVGAAVKTGYIRALDLNSHIIVKMDGDGQMHASDLPALLAPLLQKRADYTKGNRFEDLTLLKTMPFLRLLGNSVLSFLTKFSSGYWSVMDPTNGFTAIHQSALRKLTLHKIADSYFFESSMLQKLYQIQAVVEDVPLPARYGSEKSHLKIHKIMGPFLKGHLLGIGKRLCRHYFLKDFNLGSLGLILGLPLLVFGICFGLFTWCKSLLLGVPASSGTVMLCALPALLGIQLLLLFFQTDMAKRPKTPLQCKEIDLKKTLEILKSQK